MECPREESSSVFDGHSGIISLSLQQKYVVYVYQICLAEENLINMQDIILDTELQKIISELASNTCLICL